MFQDFRQWRIHLSKRFSRFVDDRALCQNRRRRRDNGRQAGVEDNLLRAICVPI